MDLPVSPESVSKGCNAAVLTGWIGAKRERREQSVGASGTATHLAPVSAKTFTRCATTRLLRTALPLDCRGFHTSGNAALR